jgi:NADPH:quinone reductase-like Zn-dependent oxidoreductase
MFKAFQPAEMFDAINRAVSANKIKPAVDKVFGFDEVQAAYQHMASGAHFGKVVIRIQAREPA